MGGERTGVQCELDNVEFHGRIRFIRRGQRTLAGWHQNVDWKGKTHLKEKKMEANLRFTLKFDAPRKADVGTPFVFQFEGVLADHGMVQFVDLARRNRRDVIKRGDGSASTNREE